VVESEPIAGEVYFETKQSKDFQKLLSSYSTYADDIHHKNL
jgi:hypothetical protein